MQVHSQHGFERVALAKPFLRTAPKIAVLQRQSERGVGGARRGQDDFADL